MRQETADAERPADLPLPIPSPWFGPVVAGIYAAVLWQLDIEAPFAVADLRALPAAAAGGPIAYFLIRWALFLQDPRFWRDRERFGTYMSELTDALGWRRVDAATADRLRAKLWRDAGVTMGWQAGLAAGAGAAVAASGHGPLASAAALYLTMLVAGWLIARLLMAEDRALFVALLNGPG